MKLKPDVDIEDAEIDEPELDHDTDEAAEVAVPRVMLRTVLLTMAAISKRELRRAISFSWRGIRALLARWRLVALIVAVAAAVGLASALFVVQYRPNQQTGDVAAHAVIKAASEGTVALLSYSPETLDNDVAAGKAHLTGELLRYFTGFSQYFVAPAVRQQRVKASASVLRAAVADMHPNSAVVLLFVHQTTSSKDKPDPVVSTNNVRVTLTKINGSWLIAKFEPE